MKKLAIGCGVLLVIGLVGAAVFTYFLVNKAQSALAEVKSTVAEFAVLGEVPEIEKRIADHSEFVAPDSGELTESQVARFLKVQQDLRTLLGTRVDDFQKKYADLAKRMDSHDNSVFDAPAVIAAYRDLARAYVEAKKAQVTALNAANFSLSEYRWVGKQAYAAAGIPVVDMDVSKVIREATAGRPPANSRVSVSGSVEPSGPDVNKSLVAPHRKALEDNVALTYFGL